MELKGQILVGMRAGLVILSAGPLATSSDELPEVEVLTTIKDGCLVYRS